MTVVDHLTKVSLEIALGGRSAPFDFILGAASSGLCPFEYELLDKSAGDRLHLTIPRELAVPTFSHLYPDLCGLLKLDHTPETLDLSISVIGVGRPGPREIVQAMARAAGQTGCGGHGGCGCGCR